MTWQIGQGPHDIVRAPSGPRGPAGPQGPVGPGVAATVTYDDSRTGLGASDVQDTLVALALMVAALRAGGFDFTNPNQSGLLALGA
jgi:hypothetical protein